MKSSWKKQRLASKKRHIKLMKWKNHFLRKYGFDNVVNLAIKLSAAIRAITEVVYSALKSIDRTMKKSCGFDRSELDESENVF